VAFTCAQSVLLPLCPRSCLVFCLLLLLEVHCCYKCNLNPRARRPMSRSGGMLMLNKSLEASLWQSARLVSALSAAKPAAEAHDSATRAHTWGTATFCRSIHRLHGCSHLASKVFVYLKIKYFWYFQISCKTCDETYWCTQCCMDWCTFCRTRTVCSVCSNSVCASPSLQFYLKNLYLLRLKRVPRSVPISGLTKWNNMHSGVRLLLRRGQLPLLR
jgi:hypothetical protein